MTRQAPDTSYWFTIGGQIEEPESARNTAIRELKEETGIVATEDDLIGTIHPRSTLVRLQRHHVPLPIRVLRTTNRRAHDPATRATRGDRHSDRVVGRARHPERPAIQPRDCGHRQRGFLTSGCAAW
ncbi:NUDIX domain-containing protein [Ornithinimicrobium faecis]|uniref:NUDIX domain-containing protein n=1 Tax=Ornithinimicrobium faecis TaxID=2934158 RepID=UPI003CE48686